MRWLTAEQEKNLVLEPSVLQKQTKSKSEVRKNKALLEQQQRDWAVVVLLLNTGLSTAEACALKWKQVKKIDNILCIHVGSIHTRAIPVNSAASEALQKLGYMENANRQRQNDFLFRNLRGRRGLSPRALQLLVRSLSAKAGVDRLTPTMLRHTFSKSIATYSTDNTLSMFAKLTGQSVLNCYRYEFKETIKIEELYDLISKITTKAEPPPGPNIII